MVMAIRGFWSSLVEVIKKSVSSFAPVLRGIEARKQFSQKTEIE
jgi:hypothetical protein